MMTKAVAAAVAAVGLLAAVAPGANAKDFCNGNGTVIGNGGGVGASDGLVYVAIDAVASHGYLFMVWIYTEANGQGGLQRGGVTLLGGADVCQDSATPDMGIF